jgi:hypothetical protein
MINFFMNQNSNRSARTSPASEAENRHPKAKQTKQFACEKCDFTGQKESTLSEHMKTHYHICPWCEETFKTKGLQKRHLKETHDEDEEIEVINYDQTQNQGKEFVYACNKCEKSFKTKDIERKHWKDVHQDVHSAGERKLADQAAKEKSGKILHCGACDFTGQSDIQMRKHRVVRHEISKVCYFWQQGICRKGEQCNFSHPPPPPPCRYAENCGFWPFCKFGHDETNFCKFQAYCKNEFCRFVHVAQDQKSFLGFGMKKQNFQRSQPTPMGRPW